MQPDSQLDQQVEQLQARNEKRRRRQEKRQKRLEEARLLEYTRPFSNFRLPVPVPSTNLQLLQLTRHESFLDSERHPPLYLVPDQKSRWARLRMVTCPVHGCGCSLDPNGLLAHYLTTHMRDLGTSFNEIPIPIATHTMRVTCRVDDLDHDCNKLLGVFGFQRVGLNPLVCSRNTMLPRDYRKYSQHGVLMLFACRTRHAQLWQRQKMEDEVIAFWVSTPLEDVSVSLRFIAQPAESTRYFSKVIKARSIPKSSAPAQPCREFIKTDRNVVVISYRDLWPQTSPSEIRQLLNVQLQVTGEQKI